ncbi:unnamed protein product [Cuscuta campestris]|uniref:Uncharacterized protein n=1 Tax=Cuscuta campestris TaxID=132261 RepID=A0A484LX11_9ASTE|nr:unnamed protein product [Cuscuta campestris]
MVPLWGHPNCQHKQTGGGAVLKSYDGTDSAELEVEGTSAAAAGGGDGPMDKSRSNGGCGFEGRGSSVVVPLLHFVSSFEHAAAAAVGVALLKSRQMSFAAAAVAAVPEAAEVLSGRWVCGSRPRLRSLRLMCVFQ